QVQFNAGTLITGQTFTVRGFVPTVQQATNASVTLGSGSGALTVQSSSNKIDNLIAGVTLNVVGADSTRDVTLTVSNDTDKARQGVLDFVQAYNDVISYIDKQASYDAQTKTAGVLLGNGSATSIEDSVRRAISNVVGGVNPLLNRLSALGITTNDQ